MATPQQSLEAAARLAAAHGVTPWILSDRLEGEARTVGRDMAALVAGVVREGRPVRPPCLLLSGGETTVTVRGPGRGGRNVEFLLALGIELGPRENVFALAGDTDGIDGTEAVAGAIWRPDTLAACGGTGPRSGPIPRRTTTRTASSRSLGDSVVTGPTRTNVNDFRAILVLPDASGS